MRRLRRILFVALVLAIGGYAFWGAIESRRLASAIADIAARGEPTSVPDAEAVPLTVEQRDAARIYAAAADRLQDVTREDAISYRQLDLDNPAQARASLEDLESRYRKDAPALQLLDQATPLDFAGFGDAAPELRVRPEPLVGLSALNALRADLMSMRGRGDQAAAALVASVRVQRTLGSSFSRYVASSRLIGSLRILLGHASPSETSLEALQHAFEALPDTDTLTRELMDSRAQFIDALARPSRTAGEAIAGRLLRPLLTRAWRRQLATFEVALAFSSGPIHERFDRTAAFERTAVAEMTAARRWRVWLDLAGRRGGGAFAGTSLNAAACDLAVRRIAITTLAVERYRRAHAGALPAGLDGLVPAYLAAVPQDPFSGKPIIYLKGPADYRIYSVDRDRKDDGGELYGIGSRGPLSPRGGAPRDYGIRVRSIPDRKEKS